MKTLKKWIPKLVACVILKNISTIFTEHIQNVKNVMAQEFRDVIKIIKIKFQSNKGYIMKKK